MMTPTQVLHRGIKCIKSSWRTAFVSAVVIGLLVHIPVMISDIPNHDGLASMYFDQNMITSGRWFLSVACGFSSYYTLPWLIGLIALLWLGVAAAMLVEFTQVEDTWCIVLISGLLVAFPAAASTFAYVFTMDGYMMALMLAVAAPLCVKKLKWGALPGAVCLAFSLGIYQSYLPFAVLLSIYGIIMLCMESGDFADKLKKTCSYLAMGVLGFVLYYVILRLLLVIEGKSLADYQGINGLEGTGASSSSLIDILKTIYYDFAAFTVNGNILANNIFSRIAVVLLVLMLIITAAGLMIHYKWWKKPWFYVIFIALIISLPIATSMLLLISPDVNYHLLMRYQWVLYLILPAAFVDKYGIKGDIREGWSTLCSWVLLVSLVVMVFNYGVTDNIGYSNLSKRYEKTYAYCLRLLDRIEQTPGYYQGIPIAMIGVVGDESYPETDITGSVTSGMTGLSGDVLLYTGANYAAFIQNYLGATLNILPPEAMEDMYYSEEYIEMESFPGADSIRIIDDVMYIKTENSDR